ncbi:MAG: helix-turn-helix domain-containing protein [Nitrospira sp.]|nr:helix-turn-helix domain-containing protein [Nitrospira sp.]
MTPGERIKKRRSALGWTQDELAAKARISKGFVSDVENNKRNISADTLLDVARVLGLSLDYLMTGEDEEKAMKQMVEIPADLAEIAELEGLSFRQAMALLQMQRQLLATRHVSKKLPSDSFDWRKFYGSVKDFL